MSKNVQSALLVIVLLSLVGCTTPTGGQGRGQPTAASAKSDKPREAPVVAGTPELAELVDGNSTFAFDLYHALQDEDGNLFYSPYSISAALAMTYAGARSETEAQMADTLHFTLPQESLHSTFNGLDLELARRGEGAEGKDGEGFRLNIANALWGLQGYEFLPEFLDLLAENYGAGLQLLDFIGDPEGSRQTINDWVSDQTEGRIEELLKPGTINELTRLVLTNAIYFNAAWAHPFEEDLTADGTFHLLDGGEASVPMMQNTESYGYARADRVQMIELPYDGHELSMVILLPDEGDFETFENSLDAEQVAEILANVSFRQIALTMPKFEIESDFDLAETLAAMGMPAAFTEAADFSGMDGTRNLSISAVVHQAFVSVDEAGTEAAAATAVVMAEAAMPEEPIEVTVDRPFIFLIRDIQTGAILFVGRVVDPGA